MAPCKTIFFCFLENTRTRKTIGHKNVLLCVQRSAQAYEEATIDHG